LFGDVAARNPWWVGPQGFEADPHLARLAHAPFRRQPAVLDIIRADEPNVYTLRGPRQVGKTTLLKLLAARLVRERDWDSRLVVYYPLDLLDRPRQLVDFVQRVKRAFPAANGRRWCFLLDEVSSLPNWQRGIKYLRDNTDAANDCFVLTGSSAMDIRRGGERLPGRRGPDPSLDKLLLPLSFPEFLAATQSQLLPANRFTAGEFLDGTADASIEEAALSLDTLEHALASYAEVGGFPAAVADYVRTGTVTSRTLTDLWDIVAGDVERWGRSRVEVLRLLGRVVRSLGAPLDWASLAVDMDVALRTAESYAAFLADAFLLLIVYFREQNGTTAIRKGKKLFATDPLILQIPHALEGSRPPDLPQVVESLVALGLYRASEADPIESFRLPRSLSFWRSSRDREVDFLAGIRPNQVAVEVKYQSRVTARDTLTIRNAFGRGLVLSRHDLDLSGPVRVLPTAVFLALLGQ
jgi:predicted AAA+ superfamily ATPase